MAQVGRDFSNLGRFGIQEAVRLFRTGRNEVQQNVALWVMIVFELQPLRACPHLDFPLVEAA